jgi:ubiquinone/menaquinone biosynthesis C-methylase UbiE
MGYIFDFKDATAYENWFFSSRNRLAADLEAKLISDMLKPLRGKSLLDIGCGTGARLAPLIGEGLDVTGVDPSPYMLDIAADKWGNRIELHRGFGESLSFEDNAFHYASLVATLEYVDDPIKVLEESLRVAREKVFIGIYNRHAAAILGRRVMGMFGETFFSHARYYTIWEIKYMIKKLVGDVPVYWKTACQFPGFFANYFHSAENWRWTQKSPFGAFAGILAIPVPRFRTTPLTLVVNSNRAPLPRVQAIETTNRQSKKKDLGDGSLSLRAC